MEKMEGNAFDFKNNRIITCRVNGEDYIAKAVEIEADSGIVKIHNKCEGTCKEHHIEEVETNGGVIVYSEKFGLDITWVFDMDKTLVFSNERVNEDSLYMELVFEEYDVTMIKLFRKLRKEYEDIKILTGRHPNLQKQIAEHFGIDEDYVFCRRVNLNPDDAKRFVQSPTMKEKFLNQLTDWKIGKLNEFASECDIVMFFDDGFDYYINRDDLAENVYCLPPPSDVMKRLKNPHV